MVYTATMNTVRILAIEKMLIDEVIKVKKLDPVIAKRMVILLQKLHEELNNDLQKV